MSENRNSSAKAEELYIRILMFSTAAMLMFVFAVFIFGRSAARVARKEETAAQSTDTLSTAGTVSTGAETNGDIGVLLPAHSYIPKTTSETRIMSDASLDAEYAILAEIGSNTVIASFHADEKIFPASMTKIMTLIIACEKLTELDESFTMTSEIVNRAIVAGASRAGFDAGEKIAVRDLLYGAAVSSGADATDALALLVAGSQEEFVKLMNEKAEWLGLSATHFVNSSGLHDDNHYSTVREIAAILQYAMENELCATVLSAKTYTTTSTPQHPNGITLYSTGFSRMSSYSFGAVTVIAAKTGYTTEGRFCLATYGTTADGRGYILVTAYGSDKYAPVYDCKYAYSTFIS